MFGLEFLFVHALWALPLAGLPVLLHLLFRRKSPVVAFPTLRFIRASIQRTAARRRIQRWLLLACRILLLGLLIWAVAQPARMLAGAWFGSGASLVAAVVVDTSYSMELTDGQLPLLTRASQTVEDLLRDELSAAAVAIFRSAPSPPEQPEQVRPAPALLSEWSPLKSEPSAVPLSDRVAAAADLLKRQDAAQKWLIVIADLQAHEFSRPLSRFEEGQLTLIDLHPDEPRSVGVTRLTVEPQQPIPGVGSEAVVELFGRAGDRRAVAIELRTPDGRELGRLPPQMAALDGSGVVSIRFPLRLPPEPSLLVQATLSADDALAWDNQRARLVQLQPRQKVRLLTFSAPGVTASPAARFVRLALDPSEGKLASWPVELRAGGLIAADDAAAVAVLSQWPTIQTLDRLRDLVRRGGTVVLLLQPGLEQSWASLDAPRRSRLLELLPAEPLVEPVANRSHRVALARMGEPLLDRIVSDPSRLAGLDVERFVPMAPTDRNVSAVLNVLPRAGGPARGLVFRRTVGQGAVYTIATLPEPHYTRLATHPIFLPMLVRMVLRPGAASESLNVELGQPLSPPFNVDPSVEALNLDSPDGETFVVRRDPSGAFIFPRPTTAGLYTWRRTDRPEPLAHSNVSYPAVETRLVYRDAASIAPAGANVLVARSLDELRGKMAEVSEPQPRWSPAIAVVLLLMCFESLLGSISGLWNPVALRSFLPIESLVRRITG